jgi:integral membrane sensor domain MASE1
MHSRFSSRLTRLKAPSGGAWKAWVGVPLRQWPVGALLSFLGASLGMPADGVAALPHEDLH